MSSLDHIISNTKLYQDIELASAVQSLKKNPDDLKRFLQTQQDSIYKDIVKQKDDSFQKVYGDLQRATDSQKAMLMFGLRNKEIDSLTQQVLSGNKANANAVVEDRDLANRKYEMNEWAVNNKKDTLFVFSQLFIILCASVIIVMLWKMGLIGVGLAGTLMAALIAIFTLTVVFRSQYTDVERNKRYWNRRYFKKAKGANIPTICGANIGDGIQSFEQGASSAIANMNSAISSGMQTASSDIQSASQNIPGDIQSASQSISNSIQSASQSMSDMVKTL